MSNKQKRKTAKIKKPTWISIHDKLPRDGSWNLFTDGKNCSVERYKHDAIDHFYPAGRWFEFDQVIAWTPLPDIPEINKENNNREKYEGGK